MNCIDKAFFSLADEIRSLDEKELYYRMRKSFDAVPEPAKRGLMTFFSQYPYWGKLDIDRGDYEEIALKQQALSQHMDDFAWLYGRLGDYRSKKTLYAILSNWYRYDFISTAQAKEYLFSSYFDLDLLSCGENEVIVDLGAYIGDTVLSYIEQYGEDRYKKFYCYEMTPETFEQLKRNLAGYRDIDLRQKGVSDVEGRPYFNHDRHFCCGTLYYRAGLCSRRRKSRRFPATGSYVPAFSKEKWCSGTERPHRSHRRPVPSGRAERVRALLRDHEGRWHYDAHEGTCTAGRTIPNQIHHHPSLARVP